MIVSGSYLNTPLNTKENLTVQPFHFHRRQVKINQVEDIKAPWRCILCWREPYEEYLGPLFGPFQLNEHCQSYLNNSKLFIFFLLFFTNFKYLLDRKLTKHYRKLREIWLHRDCALWNNHIQMNPTTGELMHISDACSTYLDTVSRARRRKDAYFILLISLLGDLIFKRHVLYVKHLVQLLPVVTETVKCAIIIHVQK